MNDEIITTETVETAADVVAEATPLTMAEEEATPEVVAEGAPASKTAANPEFRPRNTQRDTRKGGRPGARRGNRREERVKPEFDQKIISLRRVTRVVAGGRRMSFSVAVVAGNRKGKVGVGTGKAGDTAGAIEKAFRDAKKHMITIPLTKNSSIPHDVEAKYSASVAMLVPSRGRGLVAGGAVRSVLELGGVTDVTSKIFSRSKNGINNARATIKALETIRTRKSPKAVTSTN
jgi:small subunit ribosomal protein S5